MTLTFTDFFKSCYYSNTYVPPVDLSDEALSKHLLDPVEDKVALKAQELISNEDVRAVLSEPLSYDPDEVKEKNAVLQQHGFKLLSSKPLLDVQQTISFYSVIEHDDLPGHVIKSGAARIPEDQLLMGPMNDKNEMAFFTKEESILRIEMANRVAKIASESNIEVVIPQKKLVAYSNLDGIEEVTKKYCVVCEKINILSVNETVETIKNMDADCQKEVARKISTIVQKAGLVDASFDNIRLTPEGKLAFIDTEPAGLMVAKKPGIWNKHFGAKGASVEKCARIGLYTLMHQTSKAVRGTATLLYNDGLQVESGLEAFREQVKSDYEKVSSPKLSKWKITLSVFSLGLIPLVNAIVSLAKLYLTAKTLNKLQVMDQSHQQNIHQYLRREAPDSLRSFQYFRSGEEKATSGNKTQNALKNLKKEQFYKEYQSKRTPIAKRIFAYTEGVPYGATGALI